MDTIFNANKPAILAAYKSFLAEQAKLDALSKQPQVDQTRMFAAIDSVRSGQGIFRKGQYPDVASNTAADGVHADYQTG